MKKILLLLVVCFACSFRAQAVLPEPYVLDYWQCDPLSCNETLFDATGNSQTSMSINGQCRNGYQLNPYLALYTLKCELFWTLDLGGTLVSSYVTLNRYRYVLDGLKIDGLITPAEGGFAAYEAVVEKWCDQIVYSNIPPPLSPC
jgi:hypothetical protein